MGKSGGYRARLLRTTVGRLQKSERVSGRPTSANGASSFHLIWELPENLVLDEVAVTLHVPEVPVAPRLYFWALQVSFPGGSGAHLGLQWGADAPLPNAPCQLGRLRAGRQRAVGLALGATELVRESQYPGL